MWREKGRKGKDVLLHLKLPILALKFKIVTLKMMGVSTYLFSNMMKAEFYSVN